MNLKKVVIIIPRFVKNKGEIKMSISYDVYVDIWCSRCTNPIDNEDDVICKSCHEKDIKEKLQEANEALELLRPYVSEATLMKPVEISGEVAFKLKEAIRSITGC
jgi:hypothetical protein